MYASPSIPLGIAWAPYRWRVDPAIPGIERPGQLCELVEFVEDHFGDVWFVVEFGDGQRGTYLPGDLVADYAAVGVDVCRGRS